MVNATGWAELYAGNLIGAAFVMYDTALMGWMIAILFLVYQLMLYMKTQNLTLCWITGILFCGLYLGATAIVTPASAWIIFSVLIMELAGILFFLIWK